MSARPASTLCRARRVKGNRGDRQYEVKRAVDTERHRTVVIWGRAFSVGFGSARLA
jgi:hypothetical protein